LDRWEASSGLRLPGPSRLVEALHPVIEPLARRLVTQGCERIQRGSLTLMEGGAARCLGRPGFEAPKATVEVLDPRFYSYLVLRGSVGAAESYALGYWDCDDLTALVQAMALNPELAGGLVQDSKSRWLHPLLWRAHRRRRNTARMSRRNISAHYDLGNEFFQLFLDPTLTYSCGIFEEPSATLEEAQTAKYDRICRKLELAPGHEVLEIGSGWGGFAIHAARRYGCRIVTTTISREQFEEARRRIQDAGLSDRITVLNRDYRDLEGRYDRLVSIEMIEAVGADFFATFFGACSRHLRPDGLMLLQAILTPDRDYAASLRSVDFIKRYIFPGGQLPSLGAICAAVASATDLRLTDLEDLTPHYATTLRRWHAAFGARRAEARALGHPERLLRLWDLYLCACEGNFRERRIGAAQLVFAKPLCRSGPVAARGGSGTRSGWKH
jgi:cyclopropane-fatty-acyl-phospholipid synthase